MEGRRSAAAEQTPFREIVGREDEIERILRFVDAHPEGAAALVVEGQAGIGKTTLWNEGVRLLEAAGHRVLRATGAPSEAALSQSALTDLLGSVYPLVRAELPAPQRRAVDVALAIEDAPDEQADGERVLAAATLGSLMALSELGPVALAIDDCQWIDPASAAALSYALRRLGTVPVKCLFSTRLEERGALDLADLVEFRVERLPVGPLSLGATQRILLDDLGVTYPRPVVRRLVETSGGNPFYALELARGLERAGGARADEPPALTDTLDALIAARLDGVPDAAARLLGLLSLLPSAPVGLLDTLHALDGLDDAVAAKLVRVSDGVAEFEHPLLAAGALGRLGPEKRRRLHLELASVLDDPVDRAQHLARATLGESSEVASELADAAVTAARRGMPSAAAGLASAATRLTPENEPAARHERRLLEATFRAQEGAYRRAAELVDEVLPELASGDDTARALRLRARVTGDNVSQRELLLRALEEADDPAIAAESNALLVRNYLYSGDLDDALAAARAGEVHAQRTGDRSRIAAATTTVGLMQIWGTGAPDPEMLRRAGELVREGGELPADAYSNPRTLLGARALYRYELNDARREYEVAAIAADETGDVDSLETFWWGLAQVEVRAARYAVAGAHVEVLRESAESLDRRPLSVRWIEGVLATYEGRVEEAREALDETLGRAEEGENWFFGAYTRSALAFLELSLGHAAAAVDVLEPVLTTPFVVDGDPGQTGALPLAAEALVATGALDRAAAVVDRLEERGRVLEHPWCLASAARCRGLLLAERGETEDAYRAFDEALSLYERLPVPFERARTQLARGSIQRRARQRRAARESLEVARDGFEELGARIWVARADAELARIGGRAPSRGELTPNERRIAELVGDGMTNKEVASALFVTERTVESALTQIYRKLDVRSRTELSRKLTSSA